MNDIITINNYLEGQGIKRKNLGYRYLTTAINLMAESPSTGIYDLYKVIADEHSTKSTAVERAIRYSISKNNVTNKKFIIGAIAELNKKSKQA